MGLAAGRFNLGRQFQRRQAFILAAQHVQGDSQVHVGFGIRGIDED